ncbi:hypothetical protein AB1Y20_020352 [Prymnesium parvum]|uniref:Uncharacterized protein n=1 Tax=Prymnesium parvum TaxID=97485 RepID=A0AB34JXR7_PRYPA
MASTCAPVLAVTVRGGLSNQKECVVNGGIVASRLGITFALPHLDLIGTGNEKFEPQGAKYVVPYADRKRWGHFSHVFNTSRAMRLLQGHMSVIPRVRAGNAEKLEVHDLPSVESVVANCMPRVHGTCEARPRDKMLLERLISAWRPIIVAKCGDYRQKKPLSQQPRVVFNAGKSLCWNAYKSRFAESCKAQYPACGVMLNALAWNRVISRLQTRVLRGVARKSTRVGSNRSSNRSAKWAAVHVRAFVCDRDGRSPAFDRVQESLRQHGFYHGVLYLVSSIPIMQAQLALPQYELVSKATFLGDSVVTSYPFEVCAAIDYGIAVRAPLYLGEPKESSFDAFASEERMRNNRSKVIALETGVCERPAST